MAFDLIFWYLVIGKLMIWVNQLQGWSRNDFHQRRLFVHKSFTALFSI
jgi:hypothetical protein